MAITNENGSCVLETTRVDGCDLGRKRRRIVDLELAHSYLVEGVA
jgi:hypothetical protein